MARAIDLMRGYLTDRGEYSDQTPDPGAAWSMMDERRAKIARDRLDASLTSPYPQIATNLGPLPDRGWDSFFGTMAMKENAANARGGRFGVDYMGGGPGSHTGFGFWKANVDNGVSYNLADQNAGSDLARAAEAAKKAREDQAKRAVPATGGDVQPREQDYGIFGVQGVGQGVQEAAAEGAPERAPITEAPRAPQPKRQDQSWRRVSPRRRIGGTYTTPR